MLVVRWNGAGLVKARLLLATVVGISVGFWVAARAVRAYPSDPSPMEGIDFGHTVYEGRPGIASRPAESMTIRNAWLDSIHAKLERGQSLSAGEVRAVELGWLSGYTIR